jgi:mono/diheme cytochrome c family protein
LIFFKDRTQGLTMIHPFQTKARAMECAFALLATLSILAIVGPAWAQMVNSADTARKGRDLATVACSNCHQVTVDQRAAPILTSPASSFDSIAQRPDINAGVLEHFITSTRRTLDHPTDMPNPYLLEYQVQQVVTYILSLRK